MTDLHPSENPGGDLDVTPSDPSCAGAGALRQLVDRLGHTERVLRSWALAMGGEDEFSRQLQRSARSIGEAVQALREPAPGDAEGAGSQLETATPSEAVGLRGRSDMIDLVEFIGFVAGLHLDGVLTATAGSERFFVELEDGHVVWVGAEPLRDDEQLGPILVEQSAVDEQGLRLVLASQRPNEFLGEALVRFRLLDAEALRRGLEEQAVRIFQRIHRVERGFDFEFEECSRVPASMALRVGTTSLLLESARRLDEDDAAGDSPGERTVDRFREGLEALLERDQLSLPVLPNTTAQLLALCWSEDADQQELVAHVRSDPALAAHLLRTANSAAYAPTTPISDVQLAVSRLGVEKLREVAMSLALRQTVFCVEGWEEVIEELWRHSASNSSFGGAVGRRCGVGEVRGRMLGLLQDVGKPVVLQALHDIAEESDLELTMGIAQRLMEEYHASLGGHLAERWKLPDWLAGAIRHHHQVELAEEHRLEAMIANFATEMTLSTSPGASATAEDLQNLDVCAELGISPMDVHEILREGHRRP